MRSIIFSSFIVLALTGCSSVWNPSPMPSGYLHHQNTYKSPTGPEAKDIGYSYSVEENERVQAEMKNAARDLLLRAKANDIALPGAVFLTTDLPASAFRGVFDFALREELRAQGQRLVDSPDEGMELMYTAYRPKPAAAHAGEVTQNGLILSLGLPLYNELEEFTGFGQKVSAIYDVPQYGFRPTLKFDSLTNTFEALGVKSEIPSSDGRDYDVYNR